MRPFTRCATRRHRVRDADRSRREPGLGRGPRLQRPARLHHRRAARRRGARVPRPRARRPPLQRPAVAAAQDHGRNLAPSGVRKGGAGLDLPIAVGLLVAAGELSPASIEGLSFCGELGLNGSLRHVPGMIALADAAGPLGLVVPLCDVREAALVRGDEVHGAATLGELVAVLRGQADWPSVPRRDRGRAAPRTRPTCPTCGARRSGDAPWRSPRRGVTTSSWSDHPVRARRCWPNAWWGCCRR